MVLVRASCCTISLALFFLCSAVRGFIAPLHPTCGSSKVVASSRTVLHTTVGAEDRAAVAAELGKLTDDVKRLAEVVRAVQQAKNGLDITALSAAALDEATVSVTPPVARPATVVVPLAGPSSGSPSADFVAGATVTALEAVPYYDQSGVPLHTYKNKEPYTGHIVSVERCVGEHAVGDVAHIKIRHNGKIPYCEGQSFGIVPPGVGADGKPHKVRLYSIASTRYGDDGDAYVDPETGREDPAKAGVCSNFLHAAAAGSEVQLTGPVGKIMLLPESDPAADLIFVGTGTGVAPYRSFVRRLFQEDTPAARAYVGLAWLFLGVANTESLLYHDDFQSVVRRFPFNFRYDVALSREQKNRAGGKMYIQDKVEEHADEIFERLDNGAHMYFCGLKGMMPSINAMLERVAAAKGVAWDARLAELKKRGQWHVEVY